ncbi:RWD-domain-containing protein, partial [Anaeromyces robustus]
QELEALESIYFDEFEKINDEPPSFRILIESQDPYEDYIEEEKHEIIKLYLYIEYPKTYPEVKPIMEIQEAEGLDEDDISKLIEELDQVAEENLGMGMVFSLSSQLKETVDNLVVERKEQKEKEEEERRKREEEEERKKHEGTKVTVESFLAWKAKFDKEQKELEEENQLKQKKKPNEFKKVKSVLTGRQLFEQDTTLLDSDKAFAEEGDVEVDLELFE